MNFNLVSKNNIGVVVALLLVILLSVSKVFNFLLDTTLGRSVLVLFVLILAYVNKILGIVSVLFIVILFNQSDFGYLEGFTDASGNSTTPNANQQANMAAREAERKKIRQNVKADMAAKTETPATTTTPATTPALPTPAAVSMPIKGGAEGFDIIGTENYIKRGKQSNKILVSDHMRESSNVSAFDGSFTDSYSAF
jgi:hypothetical protein